MSDMSRNKMIEWLINNDIDTDDGGWLADILFHGFEGYGSMSNEQLRNEIRERDHMGEVIEDDQPAEDA